MSAIKDYMATIAESKNRTSMLLNAWREISDRLDALEKKAHEHPDKVHPTDWTVVIKGDVPYRVASFVGPNDTERSCDEHTEKQMGSVNIPFQSPLPVEVPPSSTLYTGDTERSCGNCNLLVGCKVVLSSGQDCCDFWEQYVPRQKQPTQEQLWICPKAKDCPCNQHILKKPSCNHVVPHKKSRMCESASSVCPECIPYAQEQGGDDNHCNDCCCARSWKALGVSEYDGKSIPEHIAALRARLEKAEKENAELKRKLSEVKP